MKTMTRPEVVQIKQNKLEIYLQLLVNLVGMYAAHEISVQIWRMMTGH